MKYLIVYILFLISPALVNAEDVHRASGKIQPCTQRYTPGFSEPSHIIEGYCVKKIQFADQYNRVLIEIAQSHLNKHAELYYIPEANPVGCNLLTAVLNPVQCSVSGVWKVVKLVVEEQVVWEYNN